MGSGGLSLYQSMATIHLLRISTGTDQVHTIASQLRSIGCEVVEGGDHLYVNASGPDSIEAIILFRSFVRNRLGLELYPISARTTESPQPRDNRSPAMDQVDVDLESLEHQFQDWCNTALEDPDSDSDSVAYSRYYERLACLMRRLRRDVEGVCIGSKRPENAFPGDWLDE